VFCLDVEADPTEQIDRPPADRPVVPPPPPPQSAAAAKTAIPERFVRPWELRISRDEALYDLNAEAARAGSLRAAVGRVLSPSRRREFRKWRAILAGKSADEQLWTVRPPRGSLRHPEVQAWLRQTLSGAGYDAERMALEWEIFWRRKGF
jgi:hypothetical protein